MIVFYHYTVRKWYHCLIPIWYHILAPIGIVKMSGNVLTILTYYICIIFM